MKNIIKDYECDQYGIEYETYIERLGAFPSFLSPFYWSKDMVKKYKKICIGNFVKYFDFKESE